MKKNRRNFLKLTGLAGIGFAGAGILPTYGTKMVSQPALALEPDDTSPLVPLNRFPRMVQEYFVGRVRQVEQTAKNRRSALRSRSDAENYVREVRVKIQQCFGPWPDKTPLNAHVTGILERDTYNIEKVIFESRPGFPVTANLYAGNQMVLTGESLSSWFAWDGIRALDYLLTRPEEDPKHLGVTGHSGGGTQTTWLCGVEPRFTMAAPNCFVTTFLPGVLKTFDLPDCYRSLAAKNLRQIDPWDAAT